MEAFTSFLRSDEIILNLFTCSVETNSIFHIFFSFLLIVLKDIFDTDSNGMTRLEMVQFPFRFQHISSIRTAHISGSQKLYYMK